MEVLKFEGPYVFENEGQILPDVQPGISGVYLWCFRSDAGLYRVYYIGLSTDIRERLKQHRSAQLKGDYYGHNIEKLKNNKKVLVHNPGQGILDEYKEELDPGEFNQHLLNESYLFYTEVQQEGAQNPKILLERIEAALAVLVLGSGPNILHVGSLHPANLDRDMRMVSTPGSEIQYVTGQILTY